MSDRHQSRRSTDRHDQDLPDELYRLPPPNPDLVELARIVGLISGQFAGLEKGVTQQFDNVHRRFDGVGERMDEIEENVKTRLDDLKTAVTWRGIIKSIPVLASILGIGAALVKGWAFIAGRHTHL